MERTLDPEFERRVLACPNLPSLPAAVLQILQLCRAEEIDLWKIADAVSSDPALTARVLRAANSASLAARGKVATVTRAVALLGSNAVVSLALSFSLARMRRSVDAPGLDRSVFWRRCVFSGLAGRTLVELTTTGLDPEEAFVAALLQDIGILAMAEAFPREYGPAWRCAEGDHDALAGLERDLLGADHVQVTALLARRWRLPGHLERAVAASHVGVDANDEGDVRERQLTASVALSGRIADAWIAPGCGEAVRPALEAIRERMGLEPATLEAVLTRMALAVPETSAEFDLEPGDPGRTEELLREARRLAASFGAGGDEDPLALPEGEALEGALRVAHEHARKRESPVAMLLVSCDPPASADATSRAIRVVRDCVRATDLMGKSERGDVLVLLTEADLDAGRAVAERVRRASGQAGLRLSIGLTATHEGAPLAEMRAALVAGVTAARRRGGNQVAVERANSPVTFAGSSP